MKKAFLKTFLTLAIAIGLFIPLLHTDDMGRLSLNLWPVGQHIWLISFLLTALWVLADPATRRQPLFYKIAGTVGLTVIFTRWEVGLTVWLLVQNNWLMLIAVPMVLGSISYCIPRKASEVV
jgi:hypothetical protein